MLEYALKNKLSESNRLSMRKPREIKELITTLQIIAYENKISYFNYM